MTKEELLVILRTNEDVEDDHSASDAALLAYINDPEITEAFNSVGKWYA